jgi:hypothetical protein
MSWLRGQNLDRPVIGPDGTMWHFLLWHGQIGGIYTQRIYFWDEMRFESGFINLTDSQTLPIRRLKDRLKRIAADAAYRSRFVRPLEFPIERHWHPDCD